MAATIILWNVSQVFVGIVLCHIIEVVAIVAILLSESEAHLIYMIVVDSNLEGVGRRCHVWQPYRRAW